MKLSLMACVLAGALVCSASARAQTAGAAAPNACASGDIEVVRISKLTPKGSMAGVEKAVADHGKWYADHGYAEDRVILAPVFVTEGGGTFPSISANQFLTIHAHAHQVPADRQDAAWQAYVAEYDANSQIVTQSMVCIPH